MLLPRRGRHAWEFKRLVLLLSDFSAPSWTGVLQIMSAEMPASRAWAGHLQLPCAARIEENQLVSPRKPAVPSRSSYNRRLRQRPALLHIFQTVDGQGGHSSIQETVHDTPVRRVCVVGREVWEYVVPGEDIHEGSEGPLG